MREAVQYLTSLKLTEWLGIYGAVLSTVLAIAKLVARLRAWRNRVVVTLESGEMVRFGAGGAPDFRTPSMRISIWNRGAYPVRVERIGLRFGNLRIGLDHPRLPAEVGPHDAFNMGLPVSSEKHRGRPRAYAQLTTGEAFESMRLRRGKRSTPFTTVGVAPDR